MDARANPATRRHVALERAYMTGSSPVMDRTMRFAIGRNIVTSAKAECGRTNEIVRSRWQEPMMRSNVEGIVLGGALVSVLIALHFTAIAAR